jgi:hypothetical protein
MRNRREPAPCSARPPPRRGRPKPDPCAAGSAAVDTVSYPAGARGGLGAGRPGDHHRQLGRGRAGSGRHAAISATAVGAIATVYLIGEVVGALVFGRLSHRLGRAPATVSRELARNGGRHRYRAQAADAAAFRRAQRPKPAKLVLEPRLRAVVEAKLALRCHRSRSPGGCRWPTLRIRCCGVARDDLPVAVRAEPRRAASGAATLPADGPGDALSAGQAAAPRAWAAP